MEHVFPDKRIELFFGVFILFLSFIGILGYIPQEFVRNVYLLLLFLIGVMLGSILILASLQDYFIQNSGNSKYKKLTKRKNRR